MKERMLTAGLLVILFFPLTTKSQSVYIKDITHLGIPCSLLGNEKIAIVVPKNPDAKTPQNVPALAPIQAMRFADGSFSDKELNYLEAADDYRECSKNPFYTDGKQNGEVPVKKRSLTITQQSATSITIIIKYNFAKAENRATEDGKGQQGYYHCTITIKAGEPLAMIEEETDCNFSYRFETGRNMYNQARYRGRYSSAEENGYMMVNGRKTVYKNENGFPGSEAIVDLDYRAPLNSCAPYRHYDAMAQWDIWPSNTGWYWQLYNQGGGAQSPTFGIFHGRAARLVGANCAQVNIFTRTDNRAAGVRVNINRMHPTRYYSRFVRFQWGLFLGAKQNDVSPQDQAGSLLKWFNRKSGLAEKILQYEKIPPAAAPEMEWAAFYQDKNAIQQMIKKTRTEPELKRLLTAQDPEYTTLFDAWAGNACSAEKVYQNIKTHYESFSDMMKNGQGIYALTYVKKMDRACAEKEIYTDYSHYIRAADWFRRDVLLAGSLMAAEKAGSIALRKSQKDSLNMFAGVYARVIWDDDFVPMQYTPKTVTDMVSLDHGVGYGTENMYVAYRSGRDFFALLYRNDAQFKPLASGIVNRCKKIISDIINESGASAASPHYTQPTFESLVLLLLQLKQQGVNLFETEPRLKLFARFFLHLLTPPSVRFADNRKLVSFGDGSEESAALFGLLSTGFRSSNAAQNQLSEDLDFAYRNGPMRSLPKAGIMALLYDFAKKPGNTLTPLTSNSYPGYLSHFRTNANTPQETAIWMLNGQHFNDHRNDDDGELSVYALRAPLSLSRSCLYDPHANAPTVRSMIMPYKDFPGWSANGQMIGYGDQHKRTWIQSGLNRFFDFSNAGYSSITMGKEDNRWKRDLIYVHTNPLYPVIIIKDELSNREPHIWNMPFFSEGAIKLPDNTLVNTAPPGNCVTQNQLPDAAMVKGKTEWPLQNDWNRFSFTGQEWRNYDPQKNVHGIDWWLFSYNQNKDTRASFTEWTNFYIPTTEMLEFKKTHPYKFDKNCVAKNPALQYRETQQIIRLKGSGRFLNIIMPFRKGEAPGSCNIKQNGEHQFIITRTINNILETIEVTPDAVVMSSAQKTIITTFGAAAGNSTAAQVSISGGVAELAFTGGNKIEVSVPPNSGNRVVMLPPGAWKITGQPANISIALSGNKVTILTGKDNGAISYAPESNVKVVFTK